MPICRLSTHFWKFISLSARFSLVLHPVRDRERKYGGRSVIPSLKFVHLAYQISELAKITDLGFYPDFILNTNKPIKLNTS